MKCIEKRESFGFNTFIKWNKIKIIGFVDIDKYLKLDKKFIKFMLIQIVLTISMFIILNHYFSYVILLISTIFTGFLI